MQVRWPIFGSILRTQIWTPVFLPVFKVNIGAQKWTHFWVHIMGPDLVRQINPKTHENRIRGSNFQNPPLDCSKAVAAQAVPTNWGGTDPRQPVFDAKMVLELAPKQLQTIAGFGPRLADLHNSGPQSGQIWLQLQGLAPDLSDL